MNCLSIHHRNIDTVVFDFDGTLAKLNIDFDLMRKCVDELIERYGIDQSLLKNGYILEKIDETAVLLKIKSPDAATSFRSQAYEIIEDIEMEAAKRGELFDRTRDLFKTLSRYDIRAGIITRNCMRAVQMVFPDVLLFSPVLVCRENVDKVKPHPNHLVRALELLESAPHRAIMVGDHPLDIQTGQNAGTLTAGVMTGHFREDDFLKAGADVVIPHASDILMMLKCSALS